MIKKAAILLLLFILMISSQAYALETTGTFRIVDDKNNTIASAQVTFQEGESLYAVTKRGFAIEESNGSIISINGVHSNPEKNLHWAAFINGEFVELGLKEVNLYANDRVVWALKNWDHEEIMK